MLAKVLTTLSIFLVGAASAGAQAPSPPGTPAGSGRHAASTPPSLESEPTELTLGAPPGTASDCHLSFTPYFWLTSFNGTIEANGIQVDIDKDVIDILNGTDRLFGLMGALDLDYKRFVFQLNGAWGTVEGSEEKGVFRNGTADAEVTVDGAFMELFGGYRLVDTPLRQNTDNPGRFQLDALAGARRTAISVDMTLNTSATITLPSGQVLTAGQSRNISQSGDWFEPFAGFRSNFQLDEHWLVQVRGDVGGFGVDGSQFAWQAAAVVGYEWHLDGLNVALVGGYRALGQDYSDDDFNWNVVTHGPLLGVSFAWSF